MNRIHKSSRALVVGLGMRTGLAAANFLAKENCGVYVSDVKSEDELRGVISRLDSRVTVLAGDQSPQILNKGFDLVVLSPGVPNNIPLIKAATETKIPVIAEIELAYRYLKGRIIAITGTDGKSTTTSLVGHILKGVGIHTFIGGNLGTPLISFAGDTKDDSVSVVELSSFQLESIVSFNPDVAGILNVTPDHLDRYSGMDEYFRAKMRIFMNQNSNDYFVYNDDDQILSNGLKGIMSKRLRFSMVNEDADAFYRNGSVYVRSGGRVIKVLDVKKMRIIGIHNIENTMASILFVLSIMNRMNCEPDFRRIEEVCYSFKGLSHRMEMIEKCHGRYFINDSKATTIGAVEMALKSIPENGVLIMGGRTKGDDYSRLASSMKDKIKHLVLIGESASKFKTLFKDFPQSISSSMDMAVIEAMKASREGDTIILSPACASFDMFDGFEERGNRFRESVEKLRRGELTWI